MNFTALLPIIGVINFRLRGKLSLGRSLESFFVFLSVCLFFLLFVCLFVCFFKLSIFKPKKVLNIEKEKQNKNKFAKICKYFMKKKINKPNRLICIYEWVAFSRKIDIRNRKVVFLFLFLFLFLFFFFRE